MHDEQIVVRGADAPAVPPGADPASLVRALAGLHDDFLATGRIASGVRAVVAESWRRSLGDGLDPEGTDVPVRVEGHALAELRRRSPLAPALPVVRRLLVDAATDAGLVVAVSDVTGQLLWVEGDPRLRAQAEAMRFVAGADWSEASAGTNAPGTALRTGRGVQILGPEHLMRLVMPWSCTAVPVRDPDTRAVLGALDVTGGAEVATPQTLALVRATVAAVEAELSLQRLRGPGPRRRPGGAGLCDRSLEPARLEVLGRSGARLVGAGGETVLGLRHSEIVLLLGERTDGMTGAELAVARSGREQSEVTVRAEISRLRSVLPPGALASRPYALRLPLTSDLGEVRRALAERRLLDAVRAYAGPVLPASDAPGVVDLRHELTVALRERLLAAGDVEALLAYAESPAGRDDAAVWSAAAQRLPAGSGRRRVVEQHRGALERRGTRGA